MVLQRLKEAAEKAKIELLERAGDRDQPAVPHRRRHRARSTCRCKLSRAKLEQMIERRSSSARWSRCKKALADAGKKPADIDEVVLVGGSTRIPMVQKQVKEFFGKEPHKGVNPDEVVALGAAVQAGVLSGDVKDILLLDVTPLSLGIETLGGVMTHADPAQHHHPDARRRRCSRRRRTARRRSRSTCSQGERADGARQPHARQASTSTGIPPAPRGVPQIEVTFDIDANGILNVHAKDKAHRQGAEDHHHRVVAACREDEIQKMVKDAAGARGRGQAAQARRSRRATSSTRWCFQMEKMLDENRDKIDEAGARRGRGGVKDAKKVLEANKDAKDARRRSRPRSSALQKASLQDGRADVQARRRPAAAARAASRAGRRPPGGGGAATRTT